MRLQLVSDLHLEFTNRREPMVINNVKEESDVLILAGDICTARDFDSFLPFFKDVAEKFGDVIYVVGNHEHYRFKFQDTVSRIQHELRNFNNIHVLDSNDCAVIQDTVFWGDTFWVDCNRGDQDTRQTLARCMNDFKLIRYGDYDHMLPVNAEDQHRESLHRLDSFLQREWIDKIIIVTHHSPSKQSTHPRYTNDYHLNGGYSSDEEWLIKQYPDIKLWCHGHTHDSFDYNVEKTRIVCNPAGYPTYHGTENGHFNKELVIEI